MFYLLYFVSDYKGLVTLLKNTINRYDKIGFQYSMWVWYLNYLGGRRQRCTYGTSQLYHGPALVERVSSHHILLQKCCKVLWLQS